MASWLASQLQKAENLLEAVDRTVSSATGQQARGPDSGTSVEAAYLQDVTLEPMLRHLVLQVVRCSTRRSRRMCSAV